MPKITLNADQKKAVTHKTGPLLVVAGAGTGKTRVITERIKNLIKKEKAAPNEILALTFTEKAAAEMVERLDDAMPLGYEEPWVSTFHSFCDRILKEEGLEIGLDPSYNIMPYAEQWLLFRQHLFDFKLKYFRPLGNPTKFISAVLKFISRLQDENIGPEELRKFADGFKGEKEEMARWKELAHIYEKYEALKIEHSKMDFGDLISWTLKLFNERPNLLSKYQKQFKHVLVDEFQDTNYAQYELVRLLCPTGGLEGRSLLVVGDDSQSIYKFRGAAVSNILDFQKDYPKAKMVTLLQNYRSHQEILDPAYKLIKNNNPDTLEVKLGISKELKSKVTEKGVQPRILQVATAEDEVTLVVEKILEILALEPEYKYKDFAILARANNHLDSIVFALRKYGLPYQLVGNRGLYDTDEVRDLLAVLKLILDANDSISLYRALNLDCLQIDSKVVSDILSQTRFKKISMWESVLNSGDGSVQFLVELVNKYQNFITDKTPVEFVHELVTELGVLKTYMDEETIENQMALKNLNLFLDRVKKFEVGFRRDTGELPTVIDFVDYLLLLIEAGENPAQAEIEDIDTINLMTVHSSKGLEFSVVFMLNLVSDRFPTRNRKDPIQIPEELIKETLPSGDPHVQEERRLFYVGMTRAKKYLFMLLAKSYGGKREKKPSGYLAETGLHIEEYKIETDKKQVGLFGAQSEFRSPKVVKNTPHTPYSLSYSKVSTYKNCPLQYKYRYILNIPTPPSHALSFGITIHDTLRDFEIKRRMGIEVSLEDLLKMYKKNWQPLGYLNKEHKQERYKEGATLLKNYLDKSKQDKKTPLALEKSFNLKIDGIKFFGRIDRIDSLEDGGVEIVDYKTGQTKSQKDVDRDDQVSFYAIAAQDALRMRPEKLTYYFLESGTKVTTTRTPKQLEKKKEEIGEIVSEMKEGNFKATPGMQCQWCDFKEVCPFAKKD